MALLPPPETIVRQLHVLCPNLEKTLLDMFEHASLAKKKDLIRMFEYATLAEKKKISFVSLSRTVPVATRRAVRLAVSHSQSAAIENGE